ncbi:MULTISPECIES: sulfurtransferase complex subunit TusD [unclassified Psychrobacter]|uniref:sulfurtransferase complex subunit TusD n=1 Tax=unclassified Psychrobacter TaxID=196806 RepID=UPI000EE0611C|nr:MULTISPECIES: sulfurtransferase complex subunit TusD [unclassified Psychrobacter]MBE8609209.1 sulfurtransferase complex subunit TusD [Pseudomonas lundensis]HCI74655.1 sulfurtransferase complex subunit TusD [Psychrobacter sp.]
MTTMTPLLLITADPSHPLAHLALRYARAYLKNAANNKDTNDNITLNVFFYGDAAHTANGLRWQSADQINLTKEWQTLAEQFRLALPVCVSTALSRGISDTDNSKRHQLNGDNLATGFSLVGLSELAMMMQGDCRLMQF